MWRAFDAIGEPRLSRNSEAAIALRLSADPTSGAVPLLKPHASPPEIEAPDWLPPIVFLFSFFLLLACTGALQLLLSSNSERMSKTGKSGAETTLQLASGAIANLDIDSFQDIGGRSINPAKLAALLKNKFGAGKYEIHVSSYRADGADASQQR